MTRTLIAMWAAMVRRTAVATMMAMPPSNAMAKATVPAPADPGYFAVTASDSAPPIMKVTPAK